MRFFCTCDCRETAGRLAEAAEQISRLERQYAELDVLYKRLLGRYAREQRADQQPLETAVDQPDGNPGMRGNPRAIEILLKRRR